MIEAPCPPLAGLLGVLGGLPSRPDPRAFAAGLAACECAGATRLAALAEAALRHPEGRLRRTPADLHVGIPADPDARVLRFEEATVEALPERLGPGPTWLQTP